MVILVFAEVLFDDDTKCVGVLRLLGSSEIVSMTMVTQLSFVQILDF